MNLEMIEKKVSDCIERLLPPTILKPMLGAMVAMLSEMRLPQTQIKYEYFSGYWGAPGGESIQ